MSLYDRFRGTASNLMQKYGLPGVITRTSSPLQSQRDRAAYTRPSIIIQSIPCLAILGTGKAQAQDGTLVTRTTARCDTELRTDDKLSVGRRTCVVESVTEINPDGLGGIIYIAVMRS